MLPLLVLMRFFAGASPVSAYRPVGQGGVYAVQGNVGGSRQGGQYRVQNDIAGYVAWVNLGSAPDLTQAPGYYSAFLPFSITTAPPLTGTRTYYVVVRYRDHYGLVSENQFSQTVTINAGGNPILPPVAAPTGLSLYPRPQGMVRLLAAYAGLHSDPYPADYWKVWAGSVLPNPTVDMPILVQAVSGSYLAANIGPFSPGLLYVTVGLYRSGDVSLSATVTGTVVIAEALEPVVLLP